MARVSVSELKSQLNLDHDLDDALLGQKIDAAEGYCLSYIGGEFPDPVPVPLLQAIMMLAAFWYERREAGALNCNPYIIPFGVHDILQAYRSWAV